MPIQRGHVTGFDFFMNSSPSEQEKELLEVSVPATEVFSEMIEVSGKAGMVGFFTFHDSLKLKD